MTIDPQTKHDFINNCLRLEVLMKLVSDDISKGSTPQNQHLNDLEEFLQKEINLLREIKQSLHIN